MLFAGLVLITRFFISMGINPPGDEVAYGFMGVFLVLGIACSLLAFAVIYVGWFTQ